MSLTIIEPFSDREDYTDDCVIQGFLIKQSYHLKIPKLRWMMLGTDNHLYSYKTRYKKTLTEKIDLSSFSSVRVSKVSNRWKFKLISDHNATSRTFTTYSEDSVKFIDWLDCLQQTKLLRIEMEDLMNDNFINITVTITGPGKVLQKDKYTTQLKVEYSEETKLSVLFRSVVDFIEGKIHPQRILINEIYEQSFTGGIQSRQEIESIAKLSVTEFDVKDIILGGLQLDYVIKPYPHTIIHSAVTCKHMRKLNSENPLHCPIYHSMMQQNEFSQENLTHLTRYTHFKNEYDEKPECKDKTECKSHIRQESIGNSIEDRCHMKLYRHPPRSRTIKLTENVKELVINQYRKKNAPLFKPI